MSWNFYVKTNCFIDFKELYEKLRYDRSVNAIEKSKTLVYFYGPELSTRGVDVSLEEYGYKIRITFMSNGFDLRMSLRILQIISEMTGGKVYDENNNEIIGPNYLSDEFMKTSFINDMKLMFTMIRDTGKTFEFPGPTRSVFIGKKILAQNINYEKRIKTTANIIDSLFIEILFKLPEWTEGSIIAVDSNEEEKIIKLKLVTSDDSYIIQNYDYIIIGEESKEDDMILVDKEKIEKMDPDYWYFVDECTILAEKMPMESWKIFRENCKINNCYNEFKNKSKEN
jgi:hypothetical protein